MSTKSHHSSKFVSTDFSFQEEICYCTKPIHVYLKLQLMNLLNFFCQLSSKSIAIKRETNYKDSCFHTCYPFDGMSNTLFAFNNSYPQASVFIHNSLLVANAALNTHCVMLIVTFFLLSSISFEFVDLKSRILCSVLFSMTHIEPNN